MQFPQNERTKMEPTALPLVHVRGTDLDSAPVVSTIDRTLLAIEHFVMLPSMLVAMLLRRGDAVAA